MLLVGSPKVMMAGSVLHCGLVPCRSYDRPVDHLVNHQVNHQVNHLVVASLSDQAMTTLRLTYEELAERTQRSPEGARMLARRRRWRIEHGNDGKARVIVEEADLVVRSPGHTGERPAEQPPGRSQNNHAERPLGQPDEDGFAAQLAEALASAEHWRSAAEQARADAIRANADREAVRAMAKSDVEAAARIAEAEISAARMEVIAKNELIVELKAMLAEARRPWWRRLIG
jgi:hypothetical protein